MNWTLFCQLLVTALVSFGGAWVAHIFAGNRDRLNKRRDQRITFLIEAYRRIEFISNRPEIADPEPMESAFADLQLFGSAHQVSLTQKFISDFASTKTGSGNELLRELRKDLRAELDLEPVPDKLLFLRYHPKGDPRK